MEKWYFHEDAAPGLVGKVALAKVAAPAGLAVLAGLPAMPGLPAPAAPPESFNNSFI